MLSFVQCVHIIYTKTFEFRVCIHTRDIYSLPMSFLCILSICIKGSCFTQWHTTVAWEKKKMSICFEERKKERKKKTHVHCTSTKTSSLLYVFSALTICPVIILR